LLPYYDDEGYPIEDSSVGYRVSALRITDVELPKDEKELDEWISAITSLPRGAKCRIYRILFEAEGIRISHAKDEERKWISEVRKRAKDQQP
jgi:hypothetical protein